MWLDIMQPGWNTLQQILLVLLYQVGDQHQLVMVAIFITICTSCEIHDLR